MTDWPLFDGATYEAPLDRHRLESQYMRVFYLMADGRWRTLQEIAEAVGGSLPGISARLRDFRKPKNGSYLVERRRRGAGADGLFEYRLLQPELAKGQS